MSVLRNPFATRDGRTIFISDLTADERGLKCNCYCPNCAGEFIARMGNVRVKHFAHSKEPCDEVIAYTTGLYNMIFQVLTNAEPLYIPALVISYTLPYGGVLDENSVKSIAKIAGENYDGNNRINITPGEYVHFDNVERVYNDNKTIQEIIVSVGTDKIAIKIMPPDTVCKIGSVSPHVDLATLVFDFANESDTIQTSTTELFKKILLSDKVRKYWLYNPRIEDAYSVIIDLSIKAEEERQKREDQYEKERILKEQKEQERRSEMLSKARVVDAEQLHREAQLGYREFLTQEGKHATLWVVDFPNTF